MNQPQANPENITPFPERLLGETVKIAHDLEEQETMFDLMMGMNDVEAARQALESMVKTQASKVWPRHYLQMYLNGDPEALDQAVTLATSDLEKTHIRQIPFGDNSHEYSLTAWERERVALTCARANRWAEALQITELLPLSVDGPIKRPFVRSLQRIALFQNDMAMVKQLLEYEDSVPPDRYGLDFDYEAQYRTLLARTGDEHAAEQLRFALSDTKSPDQFVDVSTQLVMAGLEDDWEGVIDYVFADYKQHGYEYMVAYGNPQLVSDRPLLVLGHILKPIIWERLAYAGVSRETAKAKVQQLLDTYDLHHHFEHFLSSHLDIGYDNYAMTVGLPSSKQHPTTSQSVRLEKLLRSKASQLKELDLTKYDQYAKGLSSEQVRTVTDLHARLAGYLCKIAGGEIDFVEDAMENGKSLVLPIERYSLNLQLMLACVRAANNSEKAQR
ncbi:hypothetical protein KA047_02055 [Candidatus Saccharibacteria bacterium]|nr:hypothetical protein [Candidatus Saccharibacteria bacterium]